LLVSLRSGVVRAVVRPAVPRRSAGALSRARPRFPRWLLAPGTGAATPHSVVRLNPGRARFSRGTTDAHSNICSNARQWFKKRMYLGIFDPGLRRVARGKGVGGGRSVPPVRAASGAGGGPP